MRVMIDDTYDTIDAAEKNCAQYMLDMIPDYVWLVNLIRTYEQHLREIAEDAFQSYKHMKDHYLCIMNGYHFMRGTQFAYLLYTPVDDLEPSFACIRCNEVRLPTPDFERIEMKYLSAAASIRKHLYGLEQHRAMSRYLKVSALRDRLFQVFFYAYAFELTTDFIHSVDDGYVEDKHLVDILYQIITEHKEHLHNVRYDWDWDCDIWYP